MKPLVHMHEPMPAYQYSPLLFLLMNDQREAYFFGHWGKIPPSCINAFGQT